MVNYTLIMRGQRVENVCSNLKYSTSVRSCQGLYSGAAEGAGPAVRGVPADGQRHRKQQVCPTLALAFRLAEALRLTVDALFRPPRAP